MVKQVIVMRKDLNMRKGKMIAQGAHASMKIFFDRMIPFVMGGDVRGLSINDDFREWIDGQFTKIVVSCDSEEELFNIERLAEDARLPCALIQDAGRTEFDGVPTYTCLAIGPAKAEKIDEITGELKLL